MKCVKGAWFEACSMGLTVFSEKLRRSVMKLNRKAERRWNDIHNCRICGLWIIDVGMERVWLADRWKGINYLLTR